MKRWLCFDWRLFEAPHVSSKDGCVLIDVYFNPPHVETAPRKDYQTWVTGCKGLEARPGWKNTKLPAPRPNSSLQAGARPSLREPQVLARPWRSLCGRRRSIAAASAKGFAGSLWTDFVGRRKEFEKTRVDTKVFASPTPRGQTRSRQKRRMSKRGFFFSSSTPSLAKWQFTLPTLHPDHIKPNRLVSFHVKPLLEWLWRHSRGAWGNVSGWEMILKSPREKFWACCTCFSAQTGIVHAFGRDC